jgi:hypothetical protein
VAVNKYVVAGGVVAVGVAAVGVGVVYCHRDFSEAAAAGDFDRAERRAGLLAINDVTPLAWLAFALIVGLVGLSVLSLIHQ